MTITTFVGQNIGAKEYKRVKKGILLLRLILLRYYFSGFCYHVPEGAVHHRYFYRGCGCDQRGKQYDPYFWKRLSVPAHHPDFKWRPARRRTLQGSHVFHVRLFCASASDLSDDRRSYDKKCFRCFCRMACDLGGLRHRNAGLLF